MEAKLIKIGNSKGLRLPQSFIKQFDLENKAVKLETTAEGILIKPVNKKVREGWEEQFKQATESEIQTENPELPLFENEFDQTEWTW